jgi:hypothetical protein
VGEVYRKTYSKRSSLGPFLSAGLGPLASVLLVGAAAVASVVSSSTKLVPRVILTRLDTTQTLGLYMRSPALQAGAGTGSIHGREGKNRGINWRRSRFCCHRN